MDYKTQIGSVTHGGGKTNDESQMPEPLEDDESWPLTDKPYFIQVLRQKNVARLFQLEIPPEVSDKLPTKSVPAQLLYRGNTWNLLLGDQKPKKKVDKHGWTKFVTDNNLKAGDACVFELMDGKLTNLVKFRVQILKDDFPSELLANAAGANEDNPIVL
ncbi:B3 domain-containing protein Os04g0386900-like [Rutidosis leptorrhynchoides]|uniref:B3 domain-containing protein Os04g0386900-like n=1 Tax=Rutidosis leptorrhynchoides TaxID=125765 RepID=UPI003A996CCF